MQSLLNMAVQQEKLLQLFNNLWCNHHIPKEWETVTVILLKTRGKIIVMITE
jgi:hypothetical protein